MKFKVLIFSFLIASSFVQSLTAQGGLLSSDYNMIGVKRIFTNLQGTLAPLDEILSFKNRSALHSYSADYSFGASYESLSHFRRNKRWILIGEVGLYYVSGTLSFKALQNRKLLARGQEYSYEMERQTQFQSLYLFTGGKVGYKIIPRYGITFVFGPKIAGRVKNQVTSNTNSFIHEHEFDSSYDTFKNNYIRDKDADLIPLQAFFSVGAFKSFSFKNRKIFIGLEYDRSLLNLHNRGNLKSHMVSISVKYAWAKKSR